MRPYGARNARVLERCAHALGYHSIYWTIDSLDSVDPPKSARFLYDRITSRSNEQLDGAIILMHVGAAQHRGRAARHHQQSAKPRFPTGHGLDIAALACALSKMQKDVKPSARTSAIDEFAVPADVLLENLETSSSGLTSEKAKEQSVRLGANQLQARQRARGLTLLLRQFTNPIVLILIGAAALSAFLRDGTDAAIIIAIVVASGLLGFWQEHTAANAVAKLTAVVATKVRVLRDGAEVLLPLEEIVPGDVVIFCAGALVPADCRLLETRDLFVNEAALTGETYPVEKTPGMISATTALAHRTNAVFMGTHVVSGTARAVVVQTGRATEFGKVYERLKLRPPETEFEHGIRRFGYLLAEITFLLVLAIFAFNVYFHEPVFDSFLFALALAVGLTPQLLPAIISINLAHGARRMAEQKVIVKRLAAIENFGSMNVLCSDKTGTLTEGEVRVHSALDPQGEASAKVMLYAYLNAANETGFVNPIDEAIRRAKVTGAAEWQKLDEIPYDFLRKRLSVLLENDGRHLLIAKGALRQMLDDFVTRGAERRLHCPARIGAAGSRAAMADMQQ